MSNKIKFLAVVGVGDDRKPRAARFDMADEVAVRKAASLMNFRVGIPRTEQASTIVVKLPEGKLFESGAGLIPLCNETTFYKLGELLTFHPSWKATGAITGRPTSSDETLLKAADALWGEIKPGSTVLAFDHTDSVFGWSAAIVMSASKNGERLDLRWRDWPGKTWSVDRRHVALLRPDVSS